MIRIEPTEYFLPKSEDSIEDVPVHPELMEVFRGYRARRPGDRFVIMAPGLEASLKVLEGLESDISALRAPALEMKSVPASRRGGEQIRTAMSTHS